MVLLEKAEGQHWLEESRVLGHDQCQGLSHSAKETEHHSSTPETLRRGMVVFSTIPEGSQRETEWMGRANTGPGSHEVG